MATQLFKITEVCDIRKQGSEIAPGKLLMGDLSACGRRIYYTDKANSQWIFYVGDTCELITEETMLAVSEHK